MRYSKTDASRVGEGRYVDANGRRVLLLHPILHCAWTIFGPEQMLVAGHLRLRAECPLGYIGALVVELSCDSEDERRSFFRERWRRVVFKQAL